MLKSCYVKGSIFVFSWVGVLLLGYPTKAEVPDVRIEDMASMLPNGKLDLQTLLSVAKKKSKIFESIQSIKLSAEAAQLSAEAPFQPLFSAQYLRSLSELEPASPFEPSKIESSSFGLGVSKGFQTGTTLSLGTRFGPTELVFPPQPNVPGSIDFNESRLDFNLSQSLWRNSFGSSSRLGLRIGQLEAEILQQQRRAQLEAYTLELTNEFYQAWLAQARVADAEETQQRRKRLLKMTQVRLSRGSAERPDFLEAEALGVSADLEQREAVERLQESWLRLAVAIDLDPKLAAQINPVDIPLALDDMDKNIEGLCKDTQTRLGSAALAVALANQKKAEAEAERAEIDKRPDLSLRARYSVNAIDSSLPTSYQEALRAEHPGWEVGLNLQWSLGEYEAEARHRRARSQNLLSQAQSKTLADQERVRWGLRCKEIERRIKDITFLQQNAKRQTERSRLEEQRFSIGRVRLNDVTRAEDEALIARIQLRQEEILLRKTIWNLRELAGQIPEALVALP